MVNSTQPSSSLLVGFEQQLIQDFFKRWWIPLTVLLSMILQLMLLATGGTRKWSIWLRATAWVAYNWSDYFSTLALGAMAQDAVATANQVYAIWAPILLLHMGAPDNISAYAIEDAELWLRHGVFMMLQVITAIFVVANSVQSWHYALISSCLMLAGPIKYAERTLALRCASNSAIVESVLPLYKFMRLEPWLSLPVKGVGDVQSQDRRERFFYIVSGEHEWYRQLLINNGEANSDSDSLLDAFTEAAKQTPSFVTLEDVVSNCRDRTLGRRVHLCLAFALFKLYRRRLTNLYMYEWRTLKIRNLFFRDSSELPFFSLSSKPEKDILSVLDMELRFLFDSIYTKAGGTAYTGIGVTFRILTFVVLMVSAIFIFLPLMRKDLEQQSSLVKEAQLITSLLLIAAIIIEVYQLLRLFVSDWTQVWLICIRIQLLEEERLLEEQRRQTPSSRNKRMRTSALIWLVERTLVCSENLQLRHVYWRHRIGQESLLAGMGDVVASTNLQVDRSWRLPLLRGCSIPIPRYESDAQLTARLKSRVMHDIIKLCSRLVSSVLNAQSGLLFPFSELLSIESLQASHWREWREPFHQYCVFVGSNSNFADSETFIVNWHLATIVCEELDRVKFFHPEQPDDNWQQGTESNYSQSELVEEDPNRREEQEAGSTTFYIDEMGDNITETVQMAKLLSRYAMYLLVHKAELLPCHADIGRKAAKNAKRSLQTTLVDARQKFLSVDLRNVIAGPQYEANASEKCSQLLHRVIMESRELSVLPDDEADGGISIQQARKQIEAAVSVEERHLAKTGRSPINDLKIPEDIKSGLTAGKLMLLGIESRKERWDLIWEIWVEVLACLASPNKAKEHVNQLTLGGEFLTHIWTFLGHIGFGRQ